MLTKKSLNLINTGARVRYRILGDTKDQTGTVIAREMQSELTFFRVQPDGKRREEESVPDCCVTAFYYPQKTVKEVVA